MWHVPSKACGFSLVALSAMVPESHIPPMSLWNFAVVLLACAGPMGPAGTLPLHVQLPSNAASCSISFAGFGASMPCARTAWNAVRVARDRIVSFVLVIPHLLCG